MTKSSRVKAQQTLIWSLSASLQTWRTVLTCSEVSPALWPFDLLRKSLRRFACSRRRVLRCLFINDAAFLALNRSHGSNMLCLRSRANANCSMFKLSLLLSPLGPMAWLCAAENALAPPDLLFKIYNDSAVAPLYI